MNLRNRKTGCVIAFSLLALLDACGGSGGGGGSSSSSPGTPGSVNYQIVSFGDSLSDVGTYAPIADVVGGGRFTTNPGQIWVQDVAQYYGDTVTAAYTIDLNHGFTAQGGFGYAEGGARVATPATTSDFLVDLIGNIEMPVTQQVTSYLQAHHSFNSNQLVFVLAGANDVLQSSGSTATVQTAATDLAQVIGQIVQNGATHVVVINLPDVGKSPKGIASVDGGTALNQLSELFNSTLATALQTDGLTSKVIQIDFNTWFDQLLAAYQANGFTVSNTGQACDPNKTPNDTALMCSRLTYVSPNADQTYMFADDLHPTTHTNTLFAQFVEQQITNAGLPR